MSYFKYIYIAGNDVDVNLYKIGKTTKDPFERVKSLNTTRVAHQLHLKKYSIVTDSHLAEKLIHENLSNWRIRNDREFFSINLEYADRIIRTVLNSNNLVYRPELPPVSNYNAPIYSSNNYHGHVISNKRLVLFVCILCGWFGVHHLVWGKITIGLLYLFTFGFLGIGWIYDIIRIATGKSYLVTWRYGVPDYYQGFSNYQNNLPQNQTCPAVNCNYVTNQQDNIMPVRTDVLEQSTIPQNIVPQPNETSKDEVNYPAPLPQNPYKESLDNDMAQMLTNETNCDLIALRTIVKYDKPSISLLFESKTANAVQIDINEQQKVVSCISRSNLFSDTQILNQIITPVYSIFDLSQKINVNAQSALFLTSEISQELDVPHVDLFNHINQYGTSRITIIKEKTISSNLRTLLEHEHYNSNLLPLGFNYENKPHYFDFGKSPHLLIRGVTGTGKSRLIHSLLISLLINMTPDQVKIMILDSTLLEYLIYNSIPHLIQPVVSRQDKVEGCLRWVGEEIRRREVMLADNNTRDILACREKTASKDIASQEMPDLFLIIDDIMGFIPRNSNSIIRLVDYIASHGRPVGVHLVLSSKHIKFDTVFSATKANIFNRISFKTANPKESTAVLGCEGAEKLHGTGDILYRHGSLQSLTRCQACYCRDSEIESVLQLIKSQYLDIEYNDIEACLTTIPKDTMEQKKQEA